VEETLGTGSHYWKSGYRFVSVVGALTTRTVPPAGHGLEGSTAGFGGAEGGFGSAVDRSGPDVECSFASQDGRRKAAKDGSSIIRGVAGSTTAAGGARSFVVSSSSAELGEALARLVIPVRLFGVALVADRPVSCSPAAAA
jgi:hypothetical protein